MKRFGNIYDRIILFENLLKAARKAQRGKRWKGDIAQFNLKLENELLALQAELQNRTYRIGSYKCFQIFDPKKRMISALPYRDRVVQHALCNIIEPIFDRGLIYDIYACREDKGSHRAVDRFTAYCRKNKYALKCDVKNYFASIDHGILSELIMKKIKDPDVLWLIRQIIDSTPSPGIPIGNLASQIFANFYLSGLDHYLKETARCRYYIRYMDDLIVFHDDKNKLGEIKDAINKYLKNLKLELHSGKSQVYLSANGVDFLGYRIYPTHRLILRQNIARARKRFRRYIKLVKSGSMVWSQLMRSIRSWISYTMHADSYCARKSLLAELDLLHEGVSP